MISHWMILTGVNSFDLYKLSPIVETEDIGYRKSW